MAQSTKKPTRRPPESRKSGRATTTAKNSPDYVEAYISQRVEQYANWYDSKCTPLKQRFLAIKSVSVVGGALVPVLVNAHFDFIPAPFDVAKVAATLLSLIVVILVSWDSVFQYGKQWKNFRSTEQFLRQEIVLFKNRTGFYAELADNKAFRIFVERIENAIAQENAVTLDTLTRDSNAGRQGPKEG